MFTFSIGLVETEQKLSEDALSSVVQTCCKTANVSMDKGDFCKYGWLIDFIHGQLFGSYKINT